MNWEFIICDVQFQLLKRKPQLFDSTQYFALNSLSPLWGLVPFIRPSLPLYRRSAAGFLNVSQILKAFPSTGSDTASLSCRFLLTNSFQFFCKFIVITIMRFSLYLRPFQSPLPATAGGRGNFFQRKMGDFSIIRI